MTHFDTKAVFLDRDGTLIVDRHYLADPTGVEVLPGVRESLVCLRQRGFLLFLFTNQSGVGRGMFTLSDVEAVNHRMLTIIDLGENLFTGTCIATERPDGPAFYRKPSPRYIDEMTILHGLSKDASWMVGNSPTDWEAGVNAGVRTAAIVNGEEPYHLRRQREQWGVCSYASLLDWVRDAFKGVDGD